MDKIATWGHESTRELVAAMRAEVKERVEDRRRRGLTISAVRDGVWGVRLERPKESA